MDTKHLIGRFIGELGSRQIFITRECLAFGKRAAVDTVLWHFVRSGVLIRLANGVFVRNDVGMKMPTLAEIIKAKARAHVRSAIPPGTQLAVKNKLVPKPRRKVKNQSKSSTKDKEGVIASCAVLGDTTSFNTIYGRVEFRRMPARKFCLAKEKATQILAAWWASVVGPNFQRLINTHISSLGKVEKKRFKELGAWAPAWISDLLLDDPPRFTTRVPKTIYPHWKDGNSEGPDIDPIVGEPAAVYRTIVRIESCLSSDVQIVRDLSRVFMRHGYDVAL